MFCDDFIFVYIHHNVIGEKITGKDTATGNIGGHIVRKSVR